MDDAIHLIVANHLLLLSGDGEPSPSPPPSSSSSSSQRQQQPTATALLAFVKLQAIHRPTWLRYRHDRPFWERLSRFLPRWSLPEHMGLRRRVITGIKLLYGRCIACGAPAPRVFMAFQARICRPCCHRLLISDMEMAWGHGVEPDGAALAGMPFIVRYHAGSVRVRFYLRQHVAARLVRPPQHTARITADQCARFMRAWPGMRPRHLKALIDRMT